MWLSGFDTVHPGLGGSGDGFRLRGPFDGFRMSLSWLFGYVMTMVAALGVPTALAVVMIMDVNPPVVVVVIAVTLGMAGGALFAFLGVLAMVAYFRIKVTPEGLGAFNFWGFYREVAWPAILSARPVNLLGLRYLHAQMVGTRVPLSLPLYLRDRERFYRLVCQYAGPNHPLTRALFEEVMVSRLRN